MQDAGFIVELIIYGILSIMSITALAVAIGRFRFYKSVQPTRYESRVRLESDLTRGLYIIGIVGGNAPYFGLLGTILGIMITFHTLALGGNLDAKTIMIGLSVALWTTVVGICVAIPCLAVSNVLRRRAHELLVDYDEAQGL